MFDHFDVSREYLLNPVHLILLAALGFAVVAYQLKDRRSLLISKLCGDVLSACYLILLGGLAGGFSAFIAVIGGIIQIVVPEEKLKETLYPRIGLAVALSAIVISFSVNRQSDLLPVMAVIYSRFAELSSSRQIIAICMFLAGMAWFCYNFTNGFIYAVLKNLIVLSSMAYGIYRHRVKI